MPEEYAPPVVAVIVTRDPGPYLEECLASIGQQDYANLDVLVIDDGSAEDSTARIAAYLPRAILRRRVAPGGFAMCANEALDGIEGATFFLFCHDDVALAPDAVSRLVEEAFRSNAGIVGPKLVGWEDARRLLGVGLVVDRLGLPAPRVVAGEVDQSQHDEVREVFAVPVGCQLVRVDLFAALGGMDVAMGRLGEDVDLCWRAQIAGARVVVAPQAVAQHLESSRLGERTPRPSALDVRAQVRALLKNYGPVHRLVSLLVLVVAALVDLAASASGATTRHRRVRGAHRWRWNLAQRASLVTERRAVRETRSVRDSVVVARMAKTWTSRRRGAPPTELHRSGRSRVEFGDLARLELSRHTGWSGARRGADEGRVLAATAVLAAVVAVGLRGVLLGHLPLAGDLLPMAPGSRLFSQFFTGTAVPGSANQAAPPAYAVVGLVAMVAGNSSALALKLLLVAGVVLGGFGMARLVSDFGSRRAPVVAALAFVASPIVWNALAAGDLSASAALASLPFVFRRLAVASGLAPFAPAHAGRRRPPGRTLLADIAPLGLVLALAASIAPIVLLCTGVVAVSVAVGSLVAGDLLAACRSVAVAAAAAVVAFACALPWSLTWFQAGAWSVLTGAAGPFGTAIRPAALLRGAAGPRGQSWVAWGLVLAAAFVLVASRGARLRWAARWWAAVLGSVGIAWAAGAGWLGGGGGDTLALLAPVAVGVAACCALGVAAFETDLARYRFGWRQALSLGAAVCFLGGLLPATKAVLDGTGGLPPAGFEQILGWMGPGPSGVPAGRVLWLGDPRALPGRPRQVTPGLAALVSTTGLPGAQADWPPPDLGPPGQLDAAVLAAEGGRTVQLGAALAPLGIRYLVLPDAAAPVIAGQQSPKPYPPTPVLTAALQAQSDLRELPVEAGIAVFQNASWTPASATRLGAAEGDVLAGGGREAGLGAGLAVVALSIAEVVLRRRRTRVPRPPHPRRGADPVPSAAPSQPAISSAERAISSAERAISSAEPAISPAEPAISPAEPALSPAATQPASTGSAARAAQPAAAETSKPSPEPPVLQGAD